MNSANPTTPPGEKQKQQLETPFGAVPDMSEFYKQVVVCRFASDITGPDATYKLLYCLQDNPSDGILLQGIPALRFYLEYMTILNDNALIPMTAWDLVQEGKSI